MRMMAMLNKRHIAVFSVTPSANIIYVKKVKTTIPDENPVNRGPKRFP